LAVALEGWTLRKFEGDKRPYWRDAKHSNQENYFARKDGPPRYTASIDAAVALVEKKLPGAEYSISTLYHLAQVELPLNAHEGPQAAAIELEKALRTDGADWKKPIRKLRRTLGLEGK